MHGLKSGAHSGCHGELGYSRGFVSFQRILDKIGHDDAVLCQPNLVVHSQHCFTPLGDAAAAPVVTLMPAESRLMDC